MLEYLVKSINENPICDTSPKQQRQKHDRAASAWWRHTKSGSIPQRLGQAIGLYSTKTG